MVYAPKIIQPLSEVSIEEALRIQKRMQCVSLNRGDYILYDGEVCRRYYFVESGTLRLFHRREEEEYTVWLGTSGEVFTNLESYLDESPSRISIQAIESTVVYTISKEQSDQLAHESNAYNTLLRKSVEKAFVGLSKNIMSYQSEPAHQRYNRLVEEKNWITKYPLKYLSSFIGVTQSTLSRIRAKK
ncbi:MAG: Crp/Fnr family transcriptional regulator [Bacteroidota bacterium]